MNKEKKSENKQDELEEKYTKEEKYEARYKHGGPMRTVKKK